MVDELKKARFEAFLRPHAVAVFGRHMPSFVMWAIGKAGVECNWNPENKLIVTANNCLGIKAVPGVPSVMIPANTGSEAGRMTSFRMFPDLESCFIELANMWNFRDFWDQLREDVVLMFEAIYVNNDVPGHAQHILAAVKDVHAIQATRGIVDHRGRFLPAAFEN